MKTKITLLILAYALVVIPSIYYLKNYDYRISHLIDYKHLGSLVIFNICVIIVVGYYLKITINNYLKV